MEERDGKKVVACHARDVKAPAVRQALDNAGWVLQFSGAGVAWAPHTVIPEPRWPESFAADGRLRHRRVLASHPRASRRS